EDRAMDRREVPLPLLRRRVQGGGCGPRALLAGALWRPRGGGDHGAGAAGRAVRVPCPPRPVRGAGPLVRQGAPVRKVARVRGLASDAGGVPEGPGDDLPREPEAVPDRDPAPDRGDLIASPAPVG